mgnify:CR=1 FL=1
MAWWVKNPTAGAQVTVEAGVQSLAWHSRLKKGSSFAATAVYVETIAGSQSPALELPYAMGVAKKKKKKKHSLSKGDTEKVS